MKQLPAPRNSRRLAVIHQHVRGAVLPHRLLSIRLVHCTAPLRHRHIDVRHDEQPSRVAHGNGYCLQDVHGARVERRCSTYSLHEILRDAACKSALLAAQQRRRLYVKRRRVCNIIFLGAAAVAAAATAACSTATAACSDATAVTVSQSGDVALRPDGSGALQRRYNIDHLCCYAIQVSIHAVENI